MTADDSPVKPTSNHGLYAKVGCSLPDDPKMIDAGDICELVYIRCLLRAREALSDGVIDRRRLPRWCIGIRGDVKKHAARLVEVGLWELHSDGWCIPADVWTRWNPMATEVQAKRDEEAERKRRFREKKRNESADVPTGQKRTHGTRDAQPEPEPEPEPQGEPETETKNPSSQNGSSTARPAGGEDSSSRRNDVIANYVRLAIDGMEQRGEPIKSRTGLERHLTEQVTAMPNLQVWPALFPTAPADAVAAWLHGDKGSMRYFPRADEIAAAADGPHEATIHALRLA